MENQKTKVHQYTDEDAEGNLIWVNYNPKTYKPQSDTRTILIDTKASEDHYNELKEQPISEVLKTEPPDRSQESFDAAVERYLSRIPKNETPEQRMKRITLFRCGY